MSTPYDTFADVYDLWVAFAAAVTEPNLRYYAQAYVDSAEPVVELGVGNGRIAIAAALRGRRVIGVDSSAAMLELAREHAAAAGVERAVELVQADFRDFRLAQPARLVAIPFHAIGHMYARADRQACFAHVFGALAPGGRLLLDHFVFDEELAAANDRRPLLRGEGTDDAGRPFLVWSTSVYERAPQVVRLLVATEHLAADGRVEETRYHRLQLAWVDPDEIRTDLEAAGFEIEALWGDFDRAPFDASSRSQVWVARRP